MDPEHRGVLLVCTPDIFRFGVASIISEIPGLEVYGQGASVREAMFDPIAHQSALAILDRRLADSSGVDACRELTIRLPDLRVVILDERPDEDIVAAALAAGASACVPRTISTSQFVTTLNAVLAGERLGPEPTLSKPPREPVIDPIHTLSRQERRVLMLLADGLTNQDIANRLFLSEKTVRNHITHILAKLGVERRTQAAVLATRHLTGR